MSAKKIKVIALDTPANEETAAEAPTESHGMDQVINDIQAGSNNTNLEESTVEVSVPEPKAKAKAKAKREPKKTSLDYEILAPPAPTPTPTSEPAQEVKAGPVADAKETCPDCGKSVSAKTLKYSHKANCKAVKPKVVQSSTDSLYSGMLDDHDPVGRDDRLQKRFENIADRIQYDRQVRMEQKMQRIARLAAHIA